MSDLTHHPQCSSVGGDACDCSGRVISTERSLDLARCRALISGDAAAVLRYEVARNWAANIPDIRLRKVDLRNLMQALLDDRDALSTALRAACVEVERLREALERIRDGAGSNTVALSDVQDERAHTWGGVYQIAVKAVGERPVHLHTTSFGHITGGAP